MRDIDITKRIEDVLSTLARESFLQDFYYDKIERMVESRVYDRLKADVLSMCKDHIERYHIERLEKKLDRSSKERNPEVIPERPLTQLDLRDAAISIHHIYTMDYQDWITRDSCFELLRRIAQHAEKHGYQDD